MDAPVKGVRLCPACGYGLEGLPEQAGKARCPECGAEHEVAKVPFITPWPSKIRTCCLMGGTTLILAGLVPVLALFASGTVLGFVAILTLTTGILSPLFVANRLVRRHATGRERDRLLMLLVLGGWALNFLIVVVWAAVTVTIVRLVLLQSSEYRTP